jgi:hypothetical protein
MKNWTIKKRIIIGFTVLLALSTLMGVQAWNSMRSIGLRAADLSANSVPSLSTEGLILQNLANAHLILVRHVLTTNLDEKHAYEIKIEEITESNTGLITNLETMCHSCKRRLKSAAGGARKVLHPPGKADWI